MAPTHHAPGTFCWFECATTDAAAATAFYEKLFGWKSDQIPMPGDAEGNYTLLKMGDEDVAGLYQMSGETGPGASPRWETYVTVEDVDGCAERARSLGGKIVAPPMDVPGVGRMATLQDPTGAKISISKPGDHPGRAELGMAPGSFGWSELATRDTAAATAFYTGLFKWGTKSDTSSSPYTELMAGDQPIGGIMEMTPRHGDTPPNWLPYVMVEDTDATAARAGDLGGRIIVPPATIPKVGRFAVFSDPVGAVLAVIRLESDHS
jgi:predicted enzyme related to lactoylglutathione lyase